MKRKVDVIMNPVRLALRVAVLGVLGVLAVSSAVLAVSEADLSAGVPSRGTEADWFYQAAALQKRFETISAAQIPYTQKTDDYYKLLDDVNKFAVAGVGQAPSPVQTPDRETRGRKAFALLCTGWIQQMLANTEVANKATADYKKSLEAMPEDEQAIARCFLERDYQRSPVCMPRVCNVEAKGYMVRVNAVDWPLRDLLQKIADAAHVRIDMPKEVSGLVDCTENEWVRVDVLIGLFVSPKGLMMMDRIAQDAIAPLRVRLWDKRYMASIAERVDENVELTGLERPQQGINAGYVILRGHYIQRPYVIDTREKDDVLYVCINGVPASSGLPLAVPQQQPEEVPALDQAKTVFEITHAISHRLVELQKQLGTEESIKRLQEELSHHPALRSASVKAQGNGARATTTLLDGTEANVRWPWLPPRPSAETDATRGVRVRVENTRLANEDRKRFEDVLRQDGLLILPGKGQSYGFTSKDGEKRLASICNIMQEIERERLGLSRALCTPDWRSEANDIAWEVMLNLRHKELVADFEARKPSEGEAQSSRQ